MEYVRNNYIVTIKECFKDNMLDEKHKFTHNLIAGFARPNYNLIVDIEMTDMLHSRKRDV